MHSVRACAYLSAVQQTYDLLIHVAPHPRGGQVTCRVGAVHLLSPRGSEKPSPV